MDIGKHPYVFYLPALISGIFLHSYIPVPFIPFLVFLGILILFLIYIVLKVRFRILFSVIILICWVLLGALLTGVNTYIPENHYVNFEEKDKLQYISVFVKEQNNSTEKNRRYIAEVRSISYKNKFIHSSGKILLLADKAQFDSVFILGNEYKLCVKIQEPFPPLNPHQFDYKKYLERNYILRTGKVEKIISKKSHSSFKYRIKNFNQMVIRQVDKSILSSDSKEFLKAFLLGDRSEMKRDTIEAYSKSGIMHLIAISGMHVAFIFGTVLGILYLFLGRKNRKAVIIISLIFVWLFGCSVGLSSSVSRSCLMITIYYAFELLKRIPNIYHSLSLSAILILVYDPYEVYSIGFQLSYISVFFIAWLTPWVMKYLKTKNKKVNSYIMEPMSLTLAAQLGTMPFVLYYFHQFSLLSIPANILLIPYTVVIMYSSLLELLVIFLPEAFQIHYSAFYDFLVRILIDSTHWISSVDFFLFKNISLSLTELVSLALAFVLLRYFLCKPALKNVYPFLICLVIFQMNRLVNDYMFSRKENLVVFYNKNFLLGLRNGKELLVMKDKGDDLNRIKSYVIDPYITGERIKKVEYKDIDYRKIYKWKSRTIQILNKNNTNIAGAVDYVVTSGSSRVNLEKSNFKNIIFSGSANTSKVKDEKPGLWVTGKDGAFIATP
ncbi:MAG: competence protein ComEC family protein [Flavobacteriaceae bacterium]|jgi:competence protein ComEC|nr:competence protein ComEC family protein [Flavobacteriaceae bacterium]